MLPILLLSKIFAMNSFKNKVFPSHILIVKVQYNYCCRRKGLFVLLNIPELQADYSRNYLKFNNMLRLLQEESVVWTK